MTPRERRDMPLRPAKRSEAGWIVVLGVVVVAIVMFGLLWS
jgi:hypothetical protein